MLTTQGPQDRIYRQYCSGNQQFHDEDLARFLYVSNELLESKFLKFGYRTTNLDESGW
jgi:hypothetical protein